MATGADNSSTAKQVLARAQRSLDQHINECPSGPERNALTSANIILMETQTGKRRG